MARSHLGPFGTPLTETSSPQVAALTLRLDETVAALGTELGTNPAGGGGPADGLTLPQREGLISAVVETLFGEAFITERTWAIVDAASEAPMMMSPVESTAPHGLPSKRPPPLVDPASFDELVETWTEDLQQPREQARRPFFLLFARGLCPALLVLLFRWSRSLATPTARWTPTPKPTLAPPPLQVEQLVGGLIRQLDGVLPWPVTRPLNAKDYTECERLHSHMRLLIAQSLTAGVSRDAGMEPALQLGDKARSTLVLEVVEAVLVSFNLYSLESALLAVAAQALLEPHAPTLEAARAAVAGAAHGNGGEGPPVGAGTRGDGEALEGDALRCALEQERARLVWRLDQHGREGRRMRRQAQQIDEVLTKL